jgi:SAM-dependent methyltransferase
MSDAGAPFPLRSFVTHYRDVRAREGQVSPDPEYARRLPFRDVTGRNRAAWRVRALHYLMIRAGLALFAATQRAALRVLDLGAGNGWMARRLAGTFYVTALDADGGDTGLGSLRDARVGRVVGDLEALPVRPASFDAVVAAAALHYAVDLQAALAEVARALRPGGLLIVADSPFYADGAAREAAHARTRAHYATFGAEPLASRYRGLTRAELDASDLFQFVAVSPGLTSLRHAWRAARGDRAAARLPVLFGRRR